MRDRYAVYDMIGKVVRFKLPNKLGGKSGDGLVTEVYRDVMEHKIELSMGKKTFVFREPSSVEFYDDSNTIVFIYGNQDPVTDETFLEEHRKASIRGSGTEEAFKALDHDFFKVNFQIYSGTAVTTNKKRRKKKRK